MKNRDYILFFLGNILIIASVIVVFKDEDIGNFIKGLGCGLVVSVVVKAITKLISKNKHRVRSGLSK